MRVAPGYSVQVVIRWGDRVLPDAPAFDVGAQSAAAQEGQFGYNNDFTAYMPLPLGSESSETGLLCVNHEFTVPSLMWPRGGREGRRERLSEAQVAVELAAHGLSVVELRQSAEAWRVVAGSRYNRRVSPLGTEIRLAGPAAGHERLKTGADPSGARVMGTLGNCAGGTTPWGTVLSAEENFHHYFRGEPEKTPEARNHRRYGLGRGRARGWAEHHARFDIAREPNEANRFGWVLELDPYEPGSTPVKRTALGRFAHECATTVVNPDGRLTVYSGDDKAFEYLYRFVSEGRVDVRERAGNRELLDAGTLYAARFEADGTMRWLPLVFGTGRLRPEHGLRSQADVLIETRRAADLAGATPMDRPEDVETNPSSGRTYVMCTNNAGRTAEQVDPANPRARNRHGHIIELIPPAVDGRADHAAPEYRWEVFLLGGNPATLGDRAMYLAEVSEHGWLSAPDNCAFDAKGRIWITTDGQASLGVSESLYAADTEGPGRGLTRCFLNAPRGAEVCGPCFTPDHRTLFLAIQHPGRERGSTFDNPSTRWPDFSEGMPPRPSVVAITRDDGGEIGS